MISPYGSETLNPLYVADEAERNRLLEAGEAMPSLVLASFCAIRFPTSMSIRACCSSPSRMKVSGRAVALAHLAAVPDSDAHPHRGHHGLPGGSEFAFL